ncbi:hypothetical protein HPB50_008223 [Hyalomma asiaticum]|uniref:Uncharacterized protein n=1 Tax=Hyalomma asiaticum TaxID=266040 RepID=A0ACB7SFG2_HYAAI|nr:hypothetical protein HPB50_008223 [Hyalomma asiaticum]
MLPGNVSRAERTCVDNEAKLTDDKRNEPTLKMPFAPSAEGTPVDSHKQTVKGAAEIPCPTVNESSPTSSDESDSEKESACSSAPPTSAGTPSTFAAKSCRPKDIIKRLQGRVCKYKKTIERLQKRQLAYVPSYDDVWTPEMEEAHRAQNRRLEEEEARHEALRHEAEEDPDDLPLSAIANEPKTVVSGASTDGLRYVCNCDMDEEPRAIYLRKIKRPALTPKREGLYLWLASWFKGLYTTCPNYNGQEDIFKAAVVNQMMQALEKCEQDNYRPDGPRDDVLLQHLGRYIEYTPVSFPPPQVDDFYLHCSEFVGSQAILTRHLYNLLGTDRPEPRELPPRPDSSPQEVVQVAVVTEQPPAPEETPKPDAAPEVPAVKEPTDASAKKKRPQQPPKPVEERKAKADDALAVPTVAQEHPPTPSLSSHPPVELPSSEDEALQDRFMDDEPTDNESFETAAWSGFDDAAQPVSCDHTLFSLALQDYRIREPHKCCPHVREALAKHIIRHPDKWGVTKRDRELLAILASLGYRYIKKEITTQARLSFPDLDFEDGAPLYDLQQLYTVEVSNRFEVLLSEPDMLDLTSEDIDKEASKLFCSGP